MCVRCATRWRLDPPPHGYGATIAATRPKDKTAASRMTYDPPPRRRHPSCGQLPHGGRRGRALFKWALKCNPTTTGRQVTYGRKITGYLVRGLCGLALVLVAFAHQPAAVSGNPGARTVDLSAYALPDGSLPQLCISGLGDSGEAGFVLGPCEFCRIAGAFLLPPPTCVPQPVVRAVAVHLTSPHDDCPVLTGHRPDAPLRGPPLA